MSERMHVRDGECRVVIMFARDGRMRRRAAAQGGRPRALHGGRDGRGLRQLGGGARRAPQRTVDDPSPGQIMLYSSGTTGKPKGVRFPLPETPYGENLSPLVTLGQGLYGFTPDMVYLDRAALPRRAAALDDGGAAAGWRAWW
ncbi:hypothetical protein AB5I41_02940 [Sphingomonas sp. MMS24-JH45]